MHDLGQRYIILVLFILYSLRPRTVAQHVTHLLGVGEEIGLILIPICFSAKELYLLILCQILDIHGKKQNALSSKIRTS